MDVDDLLARIEKRLPELTRRQKDIASFMLEHPDDMCYITLRDLASSVGVSAVTVINLCSALGFESFNEMKYAFRAFVAERRREEEANEDPAVTPFVPRGQLDRQSQLLREICQEEIDSVGGFFSGLPIDEYYRAAMMITGSRRVVVLSRGEMRPVGEFIASRLLNIGVPAVGVDTEREESIRVGCYFIERDSLLIPLFFPEYDIRMSRIARFAKKNGAAVLSITDSTRSDAVGVSDMCLFAPREDRFFFGSLTVPMVCAHVLTAAAAIEKSRSGDGSGGLSAAFSNILDE